MKNTFYDLTNPQKNILELQSVNADDESITHILAILKLKYPIDVNLFKKAIQIVIQKNDIFRVKFKEIDSKYYQYFEDVFNYEPEVKKIETEDISDFVNYYKKLPLSLNNLFSFAILLTPNHTYMFYKTHHIVSDGWSMNQVTEQIKEVYGKLVNNEPLDDFAPPSYLDFIKREESYMNSSKYTSDFKFWEDYVSKIKSSKIFHSSNNFCKKIDRFEFPISEDLSKSIDEFCNINHITEYVFFLAVFSIYFAKIYNTDSVIFGTPFLNRQKKFDEMNCAGVYISTLPLQIVIDNTADFLSICKNISATNFSIFKHSHFPYHQIQTLYNKFSQDNSNIYDIVFSYQINELKYPMPSGESGEFIWYPLGSQNNPLTIHFCVPNHHRSLMYDYWTSYFTKEQIIHMNNIILHIIHQVLDSHNKFSDIDVLSSDDVKILSDFNNSGDLEKVNCSIIDIFEYVAYSHRDKTAIYCGEDSITYGDLKKRIDFLADFLINKGIKDGDSVVLFFDKCIDMIVSMFAILKSGACYVPILPDEDINRINYILNDCKPFCIISETNISSKLSTTVPVMNIDDLTFSDVSLTKKITPEHVAYMIYTSGSTGNPKGTMVMHKNVCSLMDSVKKDSILHATDNDISISLLKYSFDASGIDIYTSLLFGGTLVLVEKDDELNPSKVLSIIEKYRVTRSFLIPKWIEHIALEDQNGNYDLSSLRILGTGGEALKPYITSHLINKYPNLKILNLYGPTETTMFTTCKLVTNVEVKKNHTTIGRPIYGSRLGIVNSFNEMLPVDVEGELIVYEDDTSISNIAKGYLNLPTQTESKFIKIFNPILNKFVTAYKTGDIAKITKDLEIEFIGRDDDVVKVNGGYLVALNEVERSIQNLLGNSVDSYPIAVPFKNTKMIILFIVKKEKNLNLYNIKNYINSNISFYMRPKKIIEIAEFPRNSSGKIDRKKLKKIAEEYLSNSKNEIILPKTDTEKTLFDILKKFVKIETLSTTDDFIDDLGIDSLALTSFYTCLKDFNINIQDIYNNPNIRDLAYFIDHKDVMNLLEVDLTDIDKAKILNNTKPFDLSCVLITGVTGFLGIHLLKDLLYNDSTKKIYCIIRNKFQKNGNQRLHDMVEYYYSSDSEINKLIDKKVVVLNGDVTKDYLGLDFNTYESLRDNVITVVNSAANVRHFVKPTQIRKDNVESVNNIIKFCGDKISLAHISTLSVVGFKKIGIEISDFDENSLYMNQNLDNNPYLISKFEAEKNILISICNDNLNANIFRIGNIMPRCSDGLFQKNASQNVFLSALKAIIECKIIPFDYLDTLLEFSPVDECSSFVINLLNKNLPYTIYHIANPYTITFKDFKNFLSSLGYDLKVTDYDEFLDDLSKYADEYTKEYLLASNINGFNETRTLENLRDCNIEWKKIDLEYIKKIINIIHHFDD